MCNQTDRILNSICNNKAKFVGWQGSFRVMTVYFSGVIAGSLGTSLSDPQTYIAGNQTNRVLLTFTLTNLQIQTLMRLS